MIATLVDVDPNAERLGLEMAQQTFPTAKALILSPWGKCFHTIYPFA